MSVDGKERQRRGALDDADKALLRGLMRRYGWERVGHPDKALFWQETYAKNNDYIEFLWFVLERLLHPFVSNHLTALRYRHQPSQVAAERASRQGFGKDGEILKGL